MIEVGLALWLAASTAFALWLRCRDRLLLFARVVRELPGFAAAAAEALRPLGPVLREMARALDAFHHAATRPTDVAKRFTRTFGQ